MARKKPAAGKGRAKTTAGKTRKRPATNNKRPKAKKSSARRKNKGRGGFPWSVLLAAILTFIIGIILVSLLGDRLKVSIPEEVREKKPAVVKTTAGMRSVSLFVSSGDGKSLKAVKVKIKKGPAKAQIKAIINKLVQPQPKGSKPSGSKIERPIPAGTKLRSVSIDGTNAILNFSKEIAENHPGGSSAELQTIYSIVNSLTMNIDEIETVQILVDGEERETLAGHIIISIPLGADKKIISR